MNKWQLSLRTNIINDESIEGFLLRLSQLNGYDEIDSHKKLRYHYSSILKQISKVNENFKNTHDLFYRLAEALTGTEISNRNNYRRNLSSRGLLLGENSIKNPLVTKYCPDCLNERKYHRIHWSMIPVIICDTHKCFLKHKCPICHHSIDLLFTITGVCKKCGSNISNLKKNLANNIEKLSGEFLGEHPFLINMNYLSDEVVFLNLTALDTYNLKKWLIYCIVYLSKVEKTILAITYYSNSKVIRIRDVDLDIINEYLMLADRLLSNWPDSLIKYIEVNMIPDEGKKFINKVFYTKHEGKLMYKINFLNEIKI